MPDTAPLRPRANRLARALRRRVRRRLDRYADRLGYARSSAAVPTPPPIPPPPPTPRVVPIGLVEVFDDVHVSGWVRALKDDFPLRISLHVNGLEVANTWADEPVKRNSSATVRGFAIAIEDLWTFCSRSDKITVQVGEQVLPINRRGIFRRPSADGARTPADLRAEFDRGYLFGQDGTLQLSRKLDTNWQASVVDLYDRLGAVIRDKYGYEPFVIYGTLLGLVREGGYISHDLDFDSAYLSRHTHGPDVAAEMRDMCLTLIDAGYLVELKRTVLHVHDPNDPELRIDLFHFWFDEQDRLCTAFGIGGTSIVHRSDWAGIEQATLGGHTVHKPVNAEVIVEHIYGPNWRTPIAGYSWARSRVSRSDPGVVPWESIEEVYWANFYAHTEFSTGSSFFQVVNARPDLPDTVIDIGCGDGRDSWAFAVAGRTVTGLDRSDVGIRHATKKAADAGLADRLSFVTADVSEPDAVRAALDTAYRAAGDRPVAFYLRFFLHSIRADVQASLLGILSEVARDGDVFAAEFRTDNDEAEHKAHGKHFRRFQNAAEFSLALQQDYGFAVLTEQEGTGLSPYKGEDPHLYRVVAVRRRA